MSIKSMAKDGSFILIYLNEKPNPVKIDCRDFTVTSFTGRAVKNIPVLVTEDIDCACWGFYRLIEILKAIKKADYYRDRYINEFRELEPFITVLDLVDRYSVPDECPKGYIKYIQDNGLRISVDTLAEFRNVQKTKNLSENDRETLDFISEYYHNTNRGRLRPILNMEIEPLKVFLKIFRTSMKKFSWNVDHDVYEFENAIADNYWRDHNWWESADTNRSFTQNVDILTAAKNKFREPEMIATEDRIRSITELESEHYKIIVPTCLEDFTIEGRQQNNCVGYYYHNNIERGYNAVYFIRRKDKPQKSNTTCRYDFNQRETVEYRIINNDDVRDNEVIELIKTVDKYLKELFAEEID